MEYKLKRKIDSYLLDWKKNPDRMPLIIKGARQIGKTSSIEHFAKTYKYFVEINFITEYKKVRSLRAHLFFTLKRHKNTC